MERDDALQRVTEKERELAQTTHALRMRIRRLEVSPCPLPTFPVVVLPCGVVGGY